VPTPEAGEQAWARIAAAAAIARVLKVADLRGRMEEVVNDPFADAEARAGAARALGVTGSAQSVKVLAGVAADPVVPPAVREAVSQALAEQGSPEARDALLSAVAVAPEPLQRALAMSLAANRDGAEALLGATAAGRASPRLLQDAALAERIAAAGVPDFDKRAKELTKGLVPADEAVRKLLEQRRAAFDPAKASAARGAAVFGKSCAACHRIGDVGAVVGPQLDGVGQRGAERIMEDVLDPNRNVDGAFRTTMLRLKGGETVSGLLRREEGELIVLADSAGKEVAVDRSKVGRRAESSLSLMPGNFGEVLTPEEFNDLMAFLVAK
jgi:putative heme-binding domain-containing protein